jgi:hypothetical protein
MPDLYESMSEMYKKASEGKVYPDAIVAAESWFRFRMGDAAFDDAFQTGRATYIAGLDLAEESDCDGHIVIVST